MLHRHKGASATLLSFQKEQAARDRITLVMKRLGHDIGPMRMEHALEAIAEKLEEYEALRNDGK